MKAQTQINKTKKKSKLLINVIKCRQLYVLLLPTLIFYIVYAYLPMFGNIMAFQDYNIADGFFGSKWIGFEHFKEFLSDKYFWRLIRNTLSISVSCLLFSFPMPIFLALFLNEIKSQKYKKTIQTITYMPHFISVVVICAMVLDFVSSDGIINNIREVFGLETVSFMTKSQFFIPIYVISDVWQQIGWSSIIYIAAIAGIDQELYEAASTDGAGKLRKTISITIPSILPTIMILFILRIGQLFEVGFEKTMLLYNETIYERADIISTYVYRRGIREMEYSYSAAVGLFNSVFNFILLISANKISRKLTESSLW